ncbi:MAG: L,D-transpeptidase [Pseudolabrys sp.]|nr:L,D-transpeptidase [Pseudolabrys sp.]
MRGLGIALAVVWLGLMAPANAEITIAVDKTQQTMAVSINGKPTYRWTISTGMPGRDTPNGSYTAQRLERVYTSKKFDDSPMPNSVFFYAGYAIHGTPHEDQLGSPVSHGCVRLARANAQTLYALVQTQGLRSTHVLVTGATPSGKVAPKIASANAPTKTSMASERLPVLLAADPPQLQGERLDPQRNAGPSLDPRYDPRLNPYSAPSPPRDARPLPPPPRRDARDDRRPDPRLRSLSRRYADPRYDVPRDPRYDPRRESRYDPRYDRRPPPRYDARREPPPRYDARHEPPRRYDPRYEARRDLPPPPHGGRLDLLREYERLTRRQAEIERELGAGPRRDLREPSPYREPPPRYREPPRGRYSDADPYRR